MFFVPKELHAIAEQVKNGESPNTTVRSLLYWFGSFRRSVKNVQRIRLALIDMDLTTTPNFAEEYIDGEIHFALRQRTATLNVTLEGVTVAATGTARGTSTCVGVGDTAVAVESATVEKREVAEITIAEPPPPAAPSPNDPTQRLKRLRSANQKPIRVHPDQSIIEAVTLMIRHDYSQLPVMTNDRVVKGMVSWRSIGGLMCLNKQAKTVRDCIEDHAELPSSASLFDAIPVIVRQGCILVRDSTQVICGIVTPSDISELYEQLAGPFLYLSEIENSVRDLIAGKLDKADLQAAKDPEDTGRTIETVADLTFGEYLWLLQKELIWQKVGLGIDRKLFTEGLDAVRVIRNEVMHFDPDGIDSEQVRTLQEFTSFLRRLRILTFALVATVAK